MSDAAILATPRPFEWKGKQLLIAFRDFETETAFGEWCKAEAALELWRLKPRVPADFYADQMALFNSKVCGKQFAWGGDEVHSIYWSDAGQRQMIWLKIMRGGELGGEILEREQVDQLAKDREAWVRLLDIMWEQDDPGFFDKNIRPLREKERAAAARSSSPPGNPPPTAAAPPSASTSPTS